MKTPFSYLAILLTLQYQIGRCNSIEAKQDSILQSIENTEAITTDLIDLRNTYVRNTLFSTQGDSTLLDFTEKTIQFSDQIHYIKGKIIGLERKGLILQYVYSDPFKALNSYQTALGIIQNYPDFSELKWSILGGIGTLYYEQEEYQKALTYFKLVLENSKELKLTATANIANIYGSINQPDSAIIFYNKALELEQNQNNPAFRANLFSNLALIYSQENRNDLALSAAKQSLALIDQFGIEFVRPTAYANAAMTYLGNGDFPKAEYYANESLRLSEASGNLFLQKSAWGTLADLLEKQGNFAASLEAYKTYSLLKDSLNNQNRRVIINLKEKEFGFEQERLIAETELQRQTGIKRISIISGIALVALLLIAFLMYKKRRDANEKRKSAEQKALIADTELKALRAQMNPHFIFNALNSIADFIANRNHETATEYLSKFAKLMRMVLENSENKTIPLSEDLKFLELYLQVELWRQPEKFDYSIEFDKELDPENILVPPLLLQPIIENSIWHGFVTTNKKGHLKIIFRKFNNHLVIAVEDNGIGISGQTQIQESTSFGLKLTRNRLQILGQDNPTKSELKIAGTDRAGTKVEIKIPYETVF